MRISFDNTWAKLEDAPPAAVQAVLAALTYKVAGAQFTRAFKAHQWNGKRTIFSMATKQFPAGLALEMAQLASKEAGQACDLVDNRVRPVASLEWLPLRLPKGASLEAHQEEAVKRVQQATRGIVHHPVGAGKSIIIMEAVRVTGVPSLILTQSKELLGQLYETARECLVPMRRAGRQPIGIVGDGMWRAGDVTVATIQTVTRGLRAGKTKDGGIDLPGLEVRQRMLDFVAGFQGLHVDEGKHLPAESYKLLMASMPGAYYRIAYDATPFRSGEAEQRLLVTGLTGPVITRRTSSDAIEFGRSVPVSLFVVEPGGEPPQDYTFVGGRKRRDYQTAVRTGIVEHVARNDKIVKLAERFADAGPTIVLTERLDHGRILSDILSGRGHKELR